jgi:hypothetical protein
MLGQKEISRFLSECDSNQAVEEVLSAYVTWKYMRGSSSMRILGKLRSLTIYLRANGQTRPLIIGKDAFTIIAIEVALGGGRIGVLPAQTVPGKQSWNKIRRYAQPSHNVTTDQQYGGPGPVSHLGLTPFQRTPSPHASERSLWAQCYFYLRPQFGNLGVPSYNSVQGIADERQSVTTLPRYQSQGVVVSQVAIESA